MGFALGNDVDEIGFPKGSDCQPESAFGSGHRILSEAAPIPVYRIYLSGQL